MFFTTKTAPKKNVLMKKLIKQFLNVKNVKVLGAKFEASTNSIIFKLQPTKGQQCLCPICGKKSEFYDKGRGLRRWRALDFGTLTAYVESESPRIKCRKHGVHTAKVPWARHQSTFTRDFEDTVTWLSLHLSRSDVSAFQEVMFQPSCGFRGIP